MEKVLSEYDSTRCQGLVKNNPCMNVAQPGSNYCALCDPEHQPKKVLKNYLLGKAQDQARLSELSTNEEIKSLREEIALTRMLIQKRLDVVKTDTDLIMACSSINALLLTVDRLVNSTHKIEQSLGELLERDTVVRIANYLVQCLIKHLENVPNVNEIIDAVLVDFNKASTKPLLPPPT
jgi:hypothetical protein